MDTGLLAYILGIENAGQVARDPLVGNLFENLVVLEAIKARANKALPPNLFFFRDQHGLEIDLMYRSADGLVGIEVKSASTYNMDFKKRLQTFTAKVAPLARSYVVYSGETMEFSDRITALNYTQTADIFLTEGPVRGKNAPTAKR